MRVVAHWQSSQLEFESIVSHVLFLSKTLYPRLNTGYQPGKRTVIIEKVFTVA